MKLPHAILLHAIQVLPWLAFVLAGTRLPASVRARWVTVASAGYALLGFASIVQTLQGRLPWDITPAMLGVLLLAAILLALPVGAAWLARWAVPLPRSGT
ncbi:MAG: hypothetical protein K0V04_03650 [Deltaproteobacteria bacterium]|nr:hypothetical protein [Deltaproteobacteria bacterium]